MRSSYFLPLCTRRLVVSLCEVGYLYRRLAAIVSRLEADMGGGLLVEAFVATLRQEISDYLRLVATLEAQISGVRISMWLLRVCFGWDTYVYSCRDGHMQMRFPIQSCKLVHIYPLYLLFSRLSHPLRCLWAPIRLMLGRYMSPLPLACLLPRPQEAQLKLAEAERVGLMGISRRYCWMTMGKESKAAGSGVWPPSASPCLVFSWGVGRW